MGPAENRWSDNFIYFVSRYTFAPEYAWHSGVYSSELAAAWVATRFHGGSGTAVIWDIRRLGFFHSLLFLAVFAAFLAFTRSLALACCALFLFADLSYSAYFNSFYLDTAALLGLLGMVALALGIVREPRSVWLVLFTLAALLFIGSKPQHGILGFLPALFLVLTRRRLAWALAAMLICATCLSPFTVPRRQKEQSLFNLIFFKLARNSADLAELGLSPPESRYLGMNAYMPGAPGDDATYLADFDARSGYSAVARFYLRHPLRALDLLRSDLENEAWQIRAVNLRNFQRQDEGRRHFQLTLWSDLRTQLFRFWPWHVAVWYGVVIAIAILRRGNPYAALLLGLAVMAAGEFCISSWTDACETYRHLFIFHAITDVTVLFVLALGYRIPSARYNSDRLT